MVFIPLYILTENPSLNENKGINIPQTDASNTTTNLIQLVTPSIPHLSSTTTTTSSNDCDLNDSSLEDLCEVVFSFRCRQCNFLCNDKSNLQSHIKEKHYNFLQNGDNSSINHQTQRQQLPNDNITFNCPCPNESQEEELDHQDKNCEIIIEDENGSEIEKINGSDDQIEDVFLCAECDIIFPSEEVCCKHMSEVHHLNQFSTGFIRDKIISKAQQTLEEEGGKPAAKRKNKSKSTDEEFNKSNKVPNSSNDKTLDINKKLQEEEVNEEEKRESKIIYSCLDCKSNFSSEDNLKIHEKCHLKDNNHPSKTFGCYLCISEKRETADLIYQGWTKCSAHLWKIHQIDCDLHVCSFCKKYKTPLLAKLRDHEKLHKPEYNFKCQTCHKSFKQLKQLRSHEKYHKEKSTKFPPEQDSRWYTPKECSICKRILSDSKCLKKHISAVHNKLKPYVCNVCGHTSARKAELKLHVRQHTGEKPFSCTTCSFQTGDHNSLRNHKLRHEKSKRPYSCPYCRYSCIQSSAFKKHIISVHPDQEKVIFICQLCSLVTVNKSHYEAHQKDHSEGRITNEEGSNSTSNSSSNHFQIPICKRIERIETIKLSTTSKWLGENDDSVDLIDTGGITIPAQPLEKEIVNNEDKNNEIEKNVTQQTITSLPGTGRIEENRRIQLNQIDLAEIVSNEQLFNINVSNFN